ncbi:hypothetical protein [Mycoplana sp. MJR14]|uniref:hypothetical protein n=1 Tax=Mycoplana sp. MJR14 TaxID=3032583 RepID=UPI000DD7B615|nr:hypothetical protein [Mycoplana sp. MJR14]MDF1631335.1 hypothetical protein [Mycoplana sp. MJR14]
MNHADMMTWEGRLNAHRKLLVSLVALFDSIPEARDAIRNIAREHETHGDHEEDPGIEPDEAYAIQRIAAEEVIDIIRSGMARSASSGNHASNDQLEMPMSPPGAPPAEH